MSLDHLAHSLICDLASGRGPAWLTTPFVSPAHLQFEKLATTRIMSWLSPCIDSGCYPGIRRLLHNTRLGRSFLRAFFGIIKNDGIQRGKFLDHPETKKLIPKDGIEWIGTTVSTFNYPTELFDLVKEGLINIHIADIDHLRTQAIHLSDGSNIKADVLLCATGWNFTPNISFLPCNLEDKIGISHASSSDPNISLADEELLRRFPELEDSPMKRLQQAVVSGKEVATPEEPPSWVLYHGLVPPHFLSSRNFAYVGMALGIRGFLLAQTEALWITAFFDDKLSTPLPREDEAAKQALMQNRFYKWKAPNGLGDRCSDMVFEVVPYVDTLLGELGLETRRKGGWAEIFQYYGVGDYPNLVQEWLGTQGK